MFVPGVRLEVSWQTRRSMFTPAAVPWMKNTQLYQRPW